MQCDTPHALKGRWLLPLLRKRYSEYSSRRDYSLNNRSWAGIEPRCATIPARSSWAVPCPLPLPRLRARLMDGPPTLLATWELVTPDDCSSLSAASSRGVEGFS